MWHDKYESHLRRIEVASSPAFYGDFAAQLLGIYSTVSVLEVSECISDKGMIPYSRDEINERYKQTVPYGNLTYVIRIHDFHRQGVSFDSSEASTHMYGPMKLTVRGPGSIAALALVGDGEILKTEKRNAHVKIDKPLLQSGWRFKTEDMETWVPIQAANQANWAGIKVFMAWVLAPRNA